MYLHINMLFFKNPNSNIKSLELCITTKALKEIRILENYSLKKWIFLFCLVRGLPLNLIIKARTLKSMREKKSSIFHSHQINLKAIFHIKQNLYVCILLLCIQEKYIFYLKSFLCKKGSAIGSRDGF